MIRRRMIWVDEEVKPSIMYRGIFFRLEEVPMKYETATLFYPVSGGYLRKNRESNLFYSSDKSQVLDWLRQRRDQRLRCLNDAVSRLEKVDLQHGFLTRIKIDRFEKTIIDTHEIDTVGKTIKTTTPHQMISRRGSKVHTVESVLYIQPNRYEIIPPTADNVRNTWIVMEDHELGAVYKWYQERIFMLEELNWS